MKSTRTFLLVLIIILLPLLAWARGAPEAVEDTVTIRFQDWRFGEMPTGEILLDIIRQYEEMNPHVRVVTETVPDAERERQFVIQSEGMDPPDIVRVLTSTMGNFAHMGLLYDVGALSEKTFDGRYGDLWVPHLLDACYWQGRLYGMPSEGDVFVLYYNTEIFREAGLDSGPTSWDDWFSQMQQVNAPDQGRYGVILRGGTGLGTSLYLTSFWLANGANFYNEDYTEIAIDSPRGIEAFEFFTELYTRHKLADPGSIEVGYIDYLGAFGTGRAATMLLHGIGQGVLEANFPQIRGKYATVPFPGTVENAPGLGRGTVHAISAQSKHPEIAWDLLSFINSAENQRRMYTEAKNYPALIEVYEDPELRRDPFFETQYQAALHAAPYPLHPTWPQVGERISVAVQEALLGIRQPAAAIRAAADDARKYMDEFRRE